VPSVRNGLYDPAEHRELAGASWSDEAAQAGTLTLAAAAGSEAKPPALVVRLESSYIPAGDGSQVAPAAEGFVVSRELLKVRGDKLPPEQLPLATPGVTARFTVGDVVEEHVRVVNPKDRHFIAVVVPLAAGMEPLNPNLATAPPEARAKGVLSRKPTYAAYLDDEVTYYYDTLPTGTFDFYFRTRATTPGSFLQPAARAEAMYDAAVRGNSAGARVEVAGAAAAPAAQEP